MTVYYNEFDPFKAEWLHNLVEAGHIALGEVDQRSIVDVKAADLRGYRQCHFFAGIGVWSYALRLAGWSDIREVWTGSCPCQPFSVAGAKRGTDDDRHLWPEFFRLIRECRPGCVVGEQVASPAALAWLDAVSADLEDADYAVGAADLCAASVGAPHIRQRLYWLANPNGGQPSDGELQRSGRLVQLAQDPLAGFWRGAEWITCTDGKARPVEPKFIALSNGNSGRMGRVGSNGCKVETEEINADPGATGPSDVLCSMQEANAPAAVQRGIGIEPEFPQAEVLQSEVHGAGADARSCDEPEPHASQGTRDGKGFMRDLREGAEDPRAPQGRESIQQCDRQFADFVRLLPSSFALAKLSGDTVTTEAMLALLKASGAEELVRHPSFKVEKVWRSLAQETQDRLRLGFEQGEFVRSFVHPLAHGATARMGRLRAYGDAINAQVAKAFIASVMECV